MRHLTASVDGVEATGMCVELLVKADGKALHMRFFASCVHASQIRGDAYVSGRRWRRRRLRASPDTNLSATNDVSQHARMVCLLTAKSKACVNLVAVTEQEFMW